MKMIVHDVCVVRKDEGFDGLVLEFTVPSLLGVPHPADEGRMPNVLRVAAGCSVYVMEEGEVIIES